MQAARLRLFVPTMLIVLAAGCSRDGEPRQPADEPEAAEHPTGVSAAEGYVATGTTPADAAAAAAGPTDFSCDKGAHVAIHGDVATVHLADGRSVDIPRMAGEASDFRGEALALHVTGQEADLSQDEAGTVHCKAG